MCWGCIETTAASLAEGFASGVLQNYVTSTSRQSCCGNHSRLLETCLDATSGLEDFQTHDRRDIVYEEFESAIERYCLDNTSPEGDAPAKPVSDTLAWRRKRPTKILWWWSCFICSLDILAKGGLLIGGVSMVLMYMDLNTANICPQNSDQWNAMPQRVQQVRVVSVMFEGWCLQFFHFVTMLFVFKWGFLRELGILSWNLVAAFTDSTYRALVQIFGLYHRPWTYYFLNVLFIMMMIINSYTIAKTFRRHFNARLMLTFQLCSQFILGKIVVSSTVYLIIPWVVTLSPVGQAFAAAAVPIFGSAVKTVSRLAVQTITGINHPGTSYVLTLACYSGAAMVYRILQAEMTEFKYFALLCVAHSLMSLLERASLVIRDHFYLWLCSKCRRCHVESRWGQFRTPRTQRLVGDITLAGMLIDSSTIVLVYFFSSFYKYRHYSNQVSDKLVGGTILLDFIARSGLALGVEFFLNALAIAILTWYLNIPLLRVWRLKSWSLVAANICFSIFLVIYTTEYLVIIVETKYRLSTHANVTIQEAHNCSTAQMFHEFFR